MIEYRLTAEEKALLLKIRQDKQSKELLKQLTELAKNIIDNRKIKSTL